MNRDQTSLVRVPYIHQVGIVVRDLEKMALQYCRLLGIGPWQIFALLPPDLYDTSYHGQPARFGTRVAFAQLGPFELELMTTVQGHTDYDDFLAEHGEGANHVQYWVDDVAMMDAHVKVLTENGFPPLVYARFGSNGGFAYMDTVRALGTVWEPVKMADRFDGPVKRFPDATADEESPIQVKKVSTIGVVVRNLDRAMNDYARILGIAPWKVATISTPEVRHYQYRGTPAAFANRTARAAGGVVDIELVEPLSGKSSFTDFMTRHGQGIHHIEFEVEDIDSTTELMKREGLGTIMSGQDSRGRFAYYDTVEPLKLIWKAVQAV